MTGSVTVRPVRPDEAATWRALRLHALADAPDAFGEQLASAQQRTDWDHLVAPRPNRQLWFAERDGRPIGMTVCVADLEAPGRAHLFAMWVDPEARRAGAATALVTAALAWARERGQPQVELCATVTNLAAVRTYERAGFVATGERPPLRPGSDVETATMVTRLPPLIMGVVNVTPNSFSDGGRYLDPDAAVAHGLELRHAGADVLDIGGEATNPRAEPIAADEELRRVMPVIERLVAGGATVSIDTVKAAVARAAVRAGARFVNDVSGGLFDPNMTATIAELDATYICGHLRGRSINEVFTDENRPVTWTEVADELAARLASLPEAVRTRAWIDPGVGFGKGGDVATNVELLRHAGDLRDRLGRPVVVGPSRKRFVAALVRTAGTATPTELDLDRETVRLAVESVRAGARMVRTHNVALLRDALTYNNT